MSAELIATDPYTLVAQHLQAGEATRAELRTLTDLDYAQIQAALERFEMMENVISRTDGAGLEHFAWKGQSYRPEPPRVSARRALAPVEPEDMNVADDLEAQPITRGRPAGWNLSAKVQEFVAAVADGAEISTPLIYDWMLVRFPKACETYEVRELRNRISMVLGNMVGRSITRAGLAEDNKTNLYRKGPGIAPVAHGAPPRALDYEQIEKLRAEGLIIEAVSLKLGYAASTLNNRHAKDARLNDALNNGLEKFAQIGVKKVTATAIEKRKPMQSAKPDYSADKKTPQVSEKNITQTITGNGYALPAFIADLRAERDELDLLIALLQKRAERQGQHST